MSDSVRPHRWQPTRFHHPCDSPGKNTGVGCYFLLQCMKVKIESEVAQLCPTPSNTMDCSPPGSSIHGICQARVLECVATAFSGHEVILSNSDLRISRLHCGQLDNVILYVLSLPLCLPSQIPNSRTTSLITYLYSVLHLKLSSQGDKDKMVGTRTGWRKMLRDFGIGSLNSQTAVRTCKQGHSDT